MTKTRMYSSNPGLEMKIAIIKNYRIPCFDTFSLPYSHQQKSHLKNDWNTHTHTKGKIREFEVSAFQNYINKAFVHMIGISNNKVLLNSCKYMTLRNLLFVYLVSVQDD